MDLDASLKSHGNRLTEIESFVESVKAMIAGSGSNAGQAPRDIDELMSFKSEFEAALPDLRKAVADTAALVDDVAAIKNDLAPALEWIAEQQKAAEAVKAAAAAEPAVQGNAASGGLAEGQSTEPPSHEPPAPEVEHAETESAG